VDEAAVYASDPASAPDTEFTPGGLRHLVPGNEGRLLDARRTPIAVVRVSPEHGSFAVRIDAFEDAGAEWELGLDEVGHFQFARDAATASDAELRELERSLARFDRELVIGCDLGTRRDSLSRVAEYREKARMWLEEQGGELELDIQRRIESREGDGSLFVLVDEFATELGLGELERSFATAFVTNPRSGELVKGHAIVLAELGLCPYRGKVARDPELFAGDHSRERRAEHILRRLAFTQALWQRLLGPDGVPLYRGTASEGPLSAGRSASFTSATFSRAVAQSHFEGGPATRTAVLWRQPLPLERLLMTFLETRAMNERYREAEAVLIGDPENPAF
jgi:hypothetical protein